MGELHDEQGRIALPGFYDRGEAGLRRPGRAQWDAMGFDEAAFLGDIGLRVPAGEREGPALERLWARPTADINGIWGGYTGPGAKTVIPAEAFAKVSFRLVPDQDPDAVVDAFRRFVTAHLPADAKAEFRVLSGAPGIEVAADSAAIRAAREVLTEEYDRPALLMGSGGSIPVVSSLKRILGHRQPADGLRAG